MSFGNKLYEARRRSGLSQDQAAEKLCVSRQTVSTWETGETLPDVSQAASLAHIYGVTLDELTRFDAEVKEIERAIDGVSEETQKRVDWTKMWSRKYPVLCIFNIHNFGKNEACY